MTNNAITLYDKGRRLTYSFVDLEKYHGFNAPAGIATAMKVMEKALPLLSSDGYIERRELRFETCFAGPGVKDAIEMMTRAVSDNRYIIDDALNEPHKGKGYRGKFFFRIFYRDKQVELILRDGILPFEFFELIAKSEVSNDEKLRIAELKTDLSNRLQSLDGRYVYRTLEENAAD